jgi:EAL domain-containing protein (putative c-di-GMP-specific phosphodiesterase class I)
MIVCILLKIDREFVKDILIDKETLQIVKAIIFMANALHKKTIADGIETKEVVKKLVVDYIPGFYFAKPMPKEELKKILAFF